MSSGSRITPYGIRPGRNATTGGAKVAATGTGTATALITNAASKTPKTIILTCTVPALISFTSGNTAVSTSVFDHYISANAPYVIDIPDAFTKIDILSEPNTGSGSLYYTVISWNG